MCKLDSLVVGARVNGVSTVNRNGNSCRIMKYPLRCMVAPTHHMMFNKALPV